MSAHYRILFVALFAALGLTLAVACGDGNGDDAPEATSTPDAASPTATSDDAADASGLQITSSAFAHNEPIPVQYTCDGDNTQPPLEISGVPDDAVSLALLVDDPDAPGGSFVHLTAWNIDPETIALGLEDPPGSVPAQDGLRPFQGLNGAGSIGYIGPCPPSGVHRYVFTLWALDTALDLDPQTTGKEELLAAIEGHVLDEAELIGTYTRE